jgi:hypothetical protein
MSRWNFKFRKLNKTKGEISPEKVKWHGVWVLENTSKTKGNLGFNNIEQNERGFKNIN